MVGRFRFWRMSLLCLVVSPLSVLYAEKAVPASAQAEVMEQPWMFEVTRHLYRWSMDETDAEKIVGKENVTFLVRGIQVELDEGDHSQLAELVLPDAGFAVKVKKAAYTIEEIGLVVSNDTFKVVNVSRVDPATLDRTRYVEVNIDVAEMKQYLFDSRSRLEFPSDDLLERLRLSVRKNLFLHLEAKGIPAPTEAQPIHVSSISPVANELWVFWEGGRVLIRYASDMDLHSPAMWDHGDLAVTIYDVDEQVVVSLGEVAGSNAYVTRDQVGRALFNCVVLGKRIVLDPKKAQNDENPRP